MHGGLQYKNGGIFIVQGKKQTHQKHNINSHQTFQTF